MDSILQNLLPVVYITDVVLLAALTYLFVRRISTPQVRYISLPSDYFVILLVGAIALSGILMRLVYKVDLFQVKGWVLSHAQLSPRSAPGGESAFLHSSLLRVPASRLFSIQQVNAHAGGFSEPDTKSDERKPQSQAHQSLEAPVKVHTYEEYEEEFRESMKERSDCHWSTPDRGVVVHCPSWGATSRPGMLLGLPGSRRNDDVRGT